MQIQRINNQTTTPQNKQSFGMKAIRGGNLQFAVDYRLLDPYALKGLVEIEEMMAKVMPDKCVDFDIFTFRGDQPMLNLKHHFEIGKIGWSDTARVPMPKSKSTEPKTLTNNIDALNDTLKRTDLPNFVKELTDEATAQIKHWENVAKEMGKTYKDV